MASRDSNLFVRLHKWAAAAHQDENFLTESLAVVLEQLLVLAPNVGTRLVAQLTNRFLELGPENAGSIKISTQLDTTQGRPDLKISTPERHVWIEVKAESPPNMDQLDRYLALVEQGEAADTRLVLLTRYRVELPVKYEKVVRKRWMEVADWLENELGVAGEVNQVARFLTQQFLEFLGARTMVLDQVGKHMPEGVRALFDLLNMLLEVAAACGHSAKKKPSWESMSIKLDGKYWVGVDYKQPAKLWFGTRSQIDPAAADRQGLKLDDDVWVPGGYSWWEGVELDSENVYFSARSKISQMQWLETFIRKCVETARSIETPEQPPIPEEPEGD